MKIDFQRREIKSDVEINVNNKTHLFTCSLIQCRRSLKIERRKKTRHMMDNAEKNECALGYVGREESLFGFHRVV